MLGVFVLLTASLAHDVQAQPSLPPPFQIIRPTAGKHLEAVEQGLSHLVSAFDGPVTIVGVVGPYRSGKSFLMNALLGDTKGFVVGSNIDSTTRGLWLRETGLRGADGSSIVFLDTEGFFDKFSDEAYDAKIFALTVLLSSHVLYNTVNTLDKAVVDYLDVLSRRTQLFNLKNHLLDDPSHGVLLRDDFPDLTWVIEDFSQDLNNCSDWLSEFLATSYHPQDLEGGVNLGIQQVFRSINCHPVFLPHTEREKLKDLAKVENFAELTSEFIQNVSSLKHTILTSVRAKKALSFSNGAKLAAFLSVIVESANSLNFPALPSLWEVWSKELLSRAFDESTSWLDGMLGFESHKQPPPNRDEFTSFVATAKAQAIAMYRGMLFGMQELLVDMEKFQVAVDQQEQSAVADNKGAIENFVVENSARVRNECLLAFPKELPLNEQALDLEASQAETECKANLEKAVGAYASSESYSKQAESLAEVLALKRRELVTSNNDLIRDLMTRASEAYLAVLDSDVNIKYPNPLEPLKASELAEHTQRLTEQAQTAFENVISQKLPGSYQNSQSYIREVELAKLSAKEKFESFARQNDENLRVVLASQMAELAQAAEQEISALGQAKDPAKVQKILDSTIEKASASPFKSEVQFESALLELKSRLAPHIEASTAPMPVASQVAVAVVTLLLATFLFYVCMGTPNRHN